MSNFLYVCLCVCFFPFFLVMDIHVWADPALGMDKYTKYSPSSILPCISFLFTLYIP